MIWEAWNIVDSLKKHVFSVITNIRCSSPTSFDFLSGIERDQIESYSTHLQQLLQSISLRFPCPSSSHDMRRMRPSLFVENDSDTIQHNPFEQQCSLLNALKSFSFSFLPEEKDDISTLSTNPELTAEIEGMKRETTLHQQEINV